MLDNFLSIVPGHVRMVWTNNSSPPCAEYMRQWIGSALVQIMACCLFSANPLSKPMLGCWQLTPYKQTSVKFWSRFKIFYSWKCIWKYCRRGDKLTEGLTYVTYSLIGWGWYHMTEERRGPFYYHGLTLIPAWISNHILCNVQDEITYPFPSFKGYTIEVWEWISNFILQFIMGVITYPCWD